MHNLTLLKMPVIENSIEKTIQRIKADARQIGLDCHGEPLPSKDFCVFMKKYINHISLLAWKKTP